MHGNCSGRIRPGQFFVAVPYRGEETQVRENRSAKPGFTREKDAISFRKTVERNGRLVARRVCICYNLREF